MLTADGLGTTHDTRHTTHDTRHTTHGARPHPGNDNSPSLRSTSCRPNKREGWKWCKILPMIMFHSNVNIFRAPWQNESLFYHQELSMIMFFKFVISNLNIFWYPTIGFHIGYLISRLYTVYVFLSSFVSISV